MPPASTATDPSAPFAVAPDLEASRGPGRLPASELRDLMRLDSRLALGHIALEWFAILAAAVVCDLFWHPLLYLATVIWIGSRQHALGVMAHDGAHGLLLRNRAWNDAVAQIFLAWPLFMAFGAYREIHVLHHRHLNTAEDPDWARNRPDRLETGPGGWEFARIMLGLNGDQKSLLDVLRSGEGAARRRSRLEALRWPLAAGVVVGFLAAGRLDALVLYWLVPLFTWFLWTMRLKGTAEHFAVENRAGANASRTVIASFPERLLIAPKNVHYHVEHHLYPATPFYRLPELHRRLMQQPEYRERIHLTRGYRAYLRECLALCRRSPTPAAAS